MAKTKNTSTELSLTDSLDVLNRNLKSMGLLPIAIVNPNDCIPQSINARYFEPSKFDQLVDNVKRTNALESAPLVYQDDALAKEGKYAIISGHHRIDAAKAAGLTSIMVMVHTDITIDELRSKQLSHNSLVGLDDKATLKQIYDSISDITAKMATGLSEEIQKIKVESVDFTAQPFKTLTVAFLPSDIVKFGEALDFFAKSSLMPNVTTHIAAMDTHESFLNLLMKLKAKEDIKSNAIALQRLVELASTAYDSLYTT